MKGWHGRLLTVDLSSGRSWSEAIPAEILVNYLGGRGLGVRLLREYHQLDPFAPELPLIFAVGPLCGTPAPTAARLTVISRSPLTGTIFDCSAGGLFAWQLKAAGFDALKIIGRSAKPIWLKVSPQGAELHPGDELWGQSIPATTASLAEHGSVAAIGPAGENRVRFANIGLEEGNVFGRGGLGAVMGGKQLKALTVAGDLPTTVLDPPRFERARRDVIRLFEASPIIFGELGLAAYGTPAMVDLLAQRRMVPTENFRQTSFPRTGNYSGPALRKAYQPKDHGCYGCPVQCGKAARDGMPLPEYDTLSHFGALNGIDDLPTLVAANQLCNQFGMDGISTAATIAAWGEARGAFPRAEEIAGLLERIALRQGEGEALAEGSARYTASLGRPELSMSVKGLELPAYDPRGAYGLALAYCTSTRGGCHLRAYPLSHEIFRKPVPTDRFDFAGKARIIKLAEDGYAAGDSLATCRFAFFAASLEEYAELLAATTGQEYSAYQLQRIGERICLSERCYNQNNGFSAEDDLLPERFFSEPGSGGEGISIPAIDRRRFDEELQRYYRLRTLSETGRLEHDFLERQP